MNTKYIAGGAATGLALAVAIAGMVSAQTASDTTGLTEQQIIGIALVEVPGEVTDIEQERRRGQQVYEVEVLGTDGIEMELYIAADTGEILKVEMENTDCDKDDGDDEDDADGPEDDEA